MLCAALVLVAGSLLAADKDDVSAAIAKLAAADNYSWKSTVTNAAAPGGGGGGGRRGGFGGGPVDGKAQKNGLMYLSMVGRGGTPTIGFVQNTNVAIQTDSGWQSLSEATADDGGGGFNPARFTAMRLQTTKAPTDQAKSLLASAKSVTKGDDGYSAELTDDGAKGLLQVTGFGRGGGPGGPGGGGPEIVISEAKASVKFWVKDGVLVKYEIKSTGKRQFGDNDPMDVNTTTTVEIKDVGATKLDLPDEAKKKLS